MRNTASGVHTPSATADTTTAALLVPAGNCTNTAEVFTTGSGGYPTGVGDASPSTTESCGGDNDTFTAAVGGSCTAMM